VRTLGVIINNVTLPHHGAYYYKDYYHSYHSYHRS